MMKTKNQEDAKLYKKARFRVAMALAVSFVLLCAYFVALYYALALPVFGKPYNFDFFFMVSMVGEILAWMIIFMMQATGNPKNRYFMYGGIILEMLLTLYIFYTGYQAETGQFAYFAWGLISLIKVYCLYCLTSWIKNSYWARIFFDKTIEVYTSRKARTQPVPASYPQGAADTRSLAGNRQPDYASAQIAPAPAYLSPRKQRKLEELRRQEAAAKAHAEALAKAQELERIRQAEIARQEMLRRQEAARREELRRQEIARQEELRRRQEEQARIAAAQAKAAEEARIAEEQKYALGKGKSTRELLDSIRVKVLTYPTMALRLGIVVYGELILFPIITELLRKFLMSTNGQYNFASTGIFTLSIISAAIWTFAMFCLYLKQPRSRWVVTGCMAAEGIAQIAYYFMVIRGFSESADFYYKSYVYILFWIIDLARFPLILWAVLPVYTMPVPLPERDNAGADVDDGHYEDYFEGSVAEDETAPSLKDALKSGYGSLASKTNSLKDKAVRAAEELSESLNPEGSASDESAPANSQSPDPAASEVQTNANSAADENPAAASDESVQMLDTLPADEAARDTEMHKQTVQSSSSSIMPERPLNNPALHPDESESETKA